MRPYRRTDPSASPGRLYRATSVQTVGRLTATILCVATAFVNTTAVCADAPFEWRHNGADARNTKFAPLDQIDSTNVEQVRMVWRWRSDEDDILKNETPGMGLGPNKSTPIHVGGVLFTVTSLSIVVALNAATGEELWTFDPESWRAEERWGWHRGPTYWSDGEGEERILFGTLDATSIPSTSIRVSLTRLSGVVAVLT